MKRLIVCMAVSAFPVAAAAQVAAVLKVPVEAIKHFDEQAAVVYFNTFNDNSWSNNYGAFSASHCTFNPLDKLAEALEENKHLYEELLKSEREKTALLQRLLDQPIHHRRYSERSYPAIGLRYVDSSHRLRHVAAFP